MKRITHLRGLPLSLAIILVLVLLIAACSATVTTDKTVVPAVGTKAVATATKAPAATASAATATKAPAVTTTAPTATKVPAGVAVPTTAGTATTAPVATTVPPTKAPVTTVSFAKDVLPIFQKNCVRCHGGNTPRSGLSLESYHNAIRGGNNAPDIIPGAPARSVLCTYPTDGTMPLGGPKIPATDAQKICDWIAQGALDN